MTFRDVRVVVSIDTLSKALVSPLLLIQGSQSLTYVQIRTCHPPEAQLPGCTAFRYMPAVHPNIAYPDANQKCIL